MKVTCIIASLRLGGAERQIIGLAETLASSGHEVELLTYHEDRFYDSSALRFGVRYHCLKARGDLSVIWALASRLKDTGCQVAIAYLPGTCIKACLAHKIYPGFKLVVSERNLNKHFLPNDFLRFQIFREADKVVCNSYSQYDFVYAHAPYLRDKLLEISNFVDLERFVPLASRSCDAPRIVVTARVCSRKNVHNLIKAAAILRGKGYSFRIDWYGLVRKNWYWRRCLALSESLDVSQVFAVHRALAKVEDVYAAADFFCLPSFYEGTSNSLAEALASGLPAICSNVSDNSRYAREGENGFLFDPSSPVDIARAVSEALDLSDEERRTYAARSRSIVESNLSPSLFAEEYRRLLESLE